MTTTVEVLEERIECLEKKLVNLDMQREKALVIAAENLSLRLTTEFATKFEVLKTNTDTIDKLEKKYEAIEGKFRAMLVVLVFAFLVLAGDIMLRVLPHFSK